jgi:hypothetical protein
VTPAQGLAFVKRHGVVLQAARGIVPSLAEAIAGAPIRGSWWAHPSGHDIFRVADAVSDSDDVLVCKLVDGKVTYVHRRVWPALVKLAARFDKQRLAKIWNEHTQTGAHRSRAIAFPKWVPDDVKREAAALSIAAAEALLPPALIGRAAPAVAYGSSDKSSRTPALRAGAASAARAAASGSPRRRARADSRR